MKHIAAASPRGCATPTLGFGHARRRGDARITVAKRTNFAPVRHRRRTVVLDHRRSSPLPRRMSLFLSPHESGTQQPEWKAGPPASENGAGCEPSREKPRDCVSTEVSRSHMVQIPDRECRSCELQESRGHPITLSLVVRFSWQDRVGTRSKPTQNAASIGRLDRLR